MKSIVKNLRLLVAALVIGAAVVTGVTSCTPPSAASTSESDKLAGTSWTSSHGELFEISSAKVFSNSYGDTLGYSGDIADIVYTTADSGYIYMKYTVSNWVSDVVGKYYAIHFENLTDTSCSFAGAFGAENATDTLDEAKTVFTVANGYFATHSECTKK